MIVADYARKNDETAGQCLSGYYGQKLDSYFKSSGYSFGQTYRTCVIKNYIKGLGVGDFRSDSKLLEYSFETGDLEPKGYYIEYLIDEISLIKPKIIIALGEFALRILSNREGISKWRGSVLELAPDIVSRLKDVIHKIKVIPTYHPYITQSAEELQYIIRFDFKKVVDILFQDRAINPHEVTIARNSGELIRFLDKYPIQEFPEMTYDIETRFGFITASGFSFDGYRGVSIPGVGSPINILEKARMEWILAKELETREIINQNVGFDRRISQRYGKLIPKIKWDTMLAANLLAAEFPKNLGFLCSLYTDMTYFKDEGKDFNPAKDSWDQLYTYNACDAIGTFQVYKKQYEELKEAEQLDFFEKFMMKLFYIYFDLESLGFIRDENKRQQLLNKYQSMLYLKELELKTISPDIKNLSSNAQIGKFMEENNFPVLRHRVNSGYMVINTDKDSLDKMKLMDLSDYRRCTLPKELAIRFIDLVLLRRRIAKIIEHIETQVWPDGRFRTSVKLAGTTSGRTANGKTIDQVFLWEEKVTKTKGTEITLYQENLGWSFQTISKHGFIIEGEEDNDIPEGIIGDDLREMYCPDPGWVIIEGDGSQAEARVCDVLGEDWTSLEEYKKFDKHCKTASMIFTQYSYEDILRMSKKLKTPEGVWMRQIGKHSKHAKNNGMEAYEFAKRYLHTRSMSDSIKKAKNILVKIDLAYPNIENVFHKGIEEELRNKRKLISPRVYGNPSGRQRLFFKKIDKHYLNVAWAWTPQTTISDHTKAAMIRIKDKLDSLKFGFLAENHDSITSMVKVGYIREYVKVVKEELERPIDFRTCSLYRDFELVIPAEFSIGRKNWGQMKEIKKIRLEN